MRKYSSYLTPDNLAIFLFHGVIDSSRYKVRNYNRKHIEKEYFEEIINDLTLLGNPVSMDEVLDHYNSRERFPEKSFCITFDDGFENNLTQAAPVLIKYNVPAVFYISTEFIEQNSMSWIDRIEYCLENKDSGLVKLPWCDKDFFFNGPRSKIEFLEYLRANVKSNPMIDLENLVELVFEQCDLEPVYSSMDPLDKKLTWEQVKELSKNKLFSIGGHSHRHLNMAFLEPKELKNQIEISINLLRNKAGIETVHYAYPEGLSYCYNAEVINSLKDFGIKCCPSAIPGINSFDVGLFDLRRIPVV